MDGHIEEIHTISSILTDSKSVIAKGFLADKDIMNTLAKTNTRFVIVFLTPAAEQSLLASNHLTEAQFLASPGLDGFLKSHVVLGPTDQDGEYISMSGMKWNIKTNGTNIPSTINGNKILYYGFTIANYETDAEKYTSPYVYSNVPLTDLK